jgi:hypothetical protein
MKNTMKCFGIIALAAVIGFSFALTLASCDNSLTSQGYNPGGGNTNPFIGTWYGTGNAVGFTLVFTSTTFSLSNGTSTAPGTYTWSGYRATLTDRSGDTGTAVISGNILTLTWSGTAIPFSNNGGGGTPTPSGTAPTITTTSLPNGLVGASYSASLSASGTTPITWSIQSGSLPAGLSLSSSGTISGTPTATGSSSFTVRATNSVGSATRSFSINITGYNTSSLDGRWLRENNGTVYTISGSSGVFTQIGTSAVYQDAARKGYIKVGDQAFRNITQTGNATWTGQILLVDYTGTSNATGTSWNNFTMTINSDGRSYNCYAPNSVTVNMTFTRY